MRETLTMQAARLARELSYLRMRREKLAAETYTQTARDRYVEACRREDLVAEQLRHARAACIRAAA